MGLADAQRRNRPLAVAWKDGIRCFNGRLWDQGPMAPRLSHYVGLR